MNPSIPIPDGSVVITPMQQYEQQQKMNETLRDVSTKLDGLGGKLDHYQEDQARRMDAIDGKDGALSELKKDDEALERRIASLERWRWVITGGVSALAGGGGLAIWQAFSVKH